jgi:hypothetical protein
VLAFFFGLSICSDTVDVIGFTFISQVQHDMVRAGNIRQLIKDKGT